MTELTSLANKHKHIIKDYPHVTFIAIFYKAYSNQHLGGIDFLDSTGDSPTYTTLNVFKYLQKPIKESKLESI